MSQNKPPEVNEGIFARVGNNTLLGVVCVMFAAAVSVFGALVVGALLSLFLGIAGMGMSMPPGPLPMKWSLTWPWVLVIVAAFAFFIFVMKRLWDTRPEPKDRTLV